MDILYIVGENCSKCDNNELRYSLRSIEKYGKNINRVFVAGYCPDFLSDEVIKVSFVQPYGYDRNENELTLTQKHINILSTILYVVDNTDISEEFLLSMDDHIYIRDVDFDDYPYYVKIFGENNELPIVGNTEYRRFLAKTRIVLESHGLSKYYFCLHRNMHCSRSVIKECRQFFEDVIKQQIPVECFAYILNYQYTHYGFPITPVTDVKLVGGSDWWKADPRNTEVISTVDFEPGIGLDCLIGGLFENKSKYEKQ